jgi:hypothetical protein
LNAIALGPDARCGWAVGDNGAILAKKQDDNHWELQESPSHEDLIDVSLLSSLETAPGINST